MVFKMTVSENPATLVSIAFVNRFIVCTKTGKILYSYACLIGVQSCIYVRILV